MFYTMRHSIRSLLLSAALFLLAVVPALAAAVKMHDFGNNFSDDAYSPYSGLTLDGSTLFGVTYNGGLHLRGALFKIEADGSGYEVVHSFDNSGGGAYRPEGRLILDGGVLYGVTISGGLNDKGTVFRINTDGSDYEVLFSYGGAASGTVIPDGPLTLVDGVFYGVTDFGGTMNQGAVYKLNMDGTGFELVHSFGTVAGEGFFRSPGGASGAGGTTLLAVGSTLYGTTPLGGSTTATTGGVGYGTIFKVNTDGSGYQVMHSFWSIAKDGANPHGELTLVGSTLYGAAPIGGARDAGALFKINTDGSGYKVLYSFHSIANDGTRPVDGLLTFGNTLYGVTDRGGSTSVGGTNGEGTAFKINTDGSGYQILHHFGAVSQDGEEPNGPLVRVGATFYGTTQTGGANTYNTGFSYTGTGTIFKITGGITAVPPVVTTLVASGITVNGATLNGTVNAKGTDRDVTFECGTTTAYGTTVMGTPGTVSSNAAVPVSVTLTNLLAHTKYNFRAKAGGTLGSANGANMTFTTLDTAPVAGDDNTTALPGGVLTLAVLSNDHDDDGDTLKLSTVKSPAATAGTAKIVGSSIVFTAAATFAGTSFTYTISDGFGKTDTGTVNIALGTCTLSPDSREVPADGTNYPVVVTANSTWSVVETLPWATVSQLSGSGNDAVQVTLLANTTKLSRRGVVIIGGKEHVILQAGTLGFTFEEPALAPVGMVCADYSLTMASPLSGVKFGASGLPSGLIINAITGEISGKPKVAGTFKVTITGTVAATGASTTIILIMTIQPLPEGAIGTFSGPIEPMPVFFDDNFIFGGRFELTTTSTGSFSGKLIGDLRTYSFSSNIDFTLHATVGSEIVTASFAVFRIGRPALQVTFTIDSVNNRVINGSFLDPNIYASVFQAWRNVWNTPGISVPDQADLNRYLGLYTFALHVPNAQPALPQGSGYGSFTVAPKTGALTAAGKLADNTGFTYSTFARADGEVFIFQPLYGGKGRILGTLDITPGSAGFTPPYGDNTLSGTVSWLRPAIAGRLYSSGFGPYNLTAVGGRYVPPAPATSIVMSILDDLINNNSRLTFTGANFVAVNPGIPFRLKASSAFVKPAALNNPASTTLTVTPATGAFTGGFSLSETNPLGGTAVRPATYYGQIVRDVDSVMRGYGFYILADLPQTAGQTVNNTNQQSGLVVLEKHP